MLLAHNFLRRVHHRCSVAFFVASTACLSALSLSAQTNVPLPAPTEWAAPLGAPTAPGDTFNANFTGAPSPADAPVISEWNRGYVKPDESFTLTGVRFTRRSGTLATTDTTVWLYAATPQGGTLRSCRVWKAEDSLLIAAVPADVPFGLYLVWVENEAGASAPICLNRPAPTWIGPIDNRALPGDTKRLFGKGLARNHGLVESHVYLQPSTGGAFVAATVTAVEPYMVSFTVPAGLANGDYQAYVHSGHGGAFGWSDPLTLTLGPPAFTRDDSMIAVPPSGGDDTPALQAALYTTRGGFNGAPDYPFTNIHGGTVQLSAGTYTLKSPLSMASRSRLRGAGKTATVIRIDTGDRAISSEAYTALEDLTLRQVNISGNNAVFDATGQPGIVLRNVRVDDDGNQTNGEPAIIIEKGEVSGCDFYRGIYTPSGDGLWIHDSNFYGSLHNDAEAAIFTIYTNNHIVVEDCLFATPAWPTGPGGSRNYKNFLTPDQYKRLNFCPRVYSGGGSNLYFGHNLADDVAPGMDDTNKGEMILFHAHATGAAAQIASSTATESIIRTDGLINGQTVTLGSNGGGFSPAFTSIPAGPGLPWDVTIIAGTGRGQSRKIVTNTATHFTVDRPWRVPPSADSVISLSILYRDNVVYQNELNAFPEGYLDSSSASSGVVFDGNCWNSTMEGNLSRRTFAARNLHGWQTAPGFWNEARDETALELHMLGYRMFEYGFGGENTIGAGVLGNAVRGGTLSFQTARQPAVALPQSAILFGESIFAGGHIVENLTSTGSQFGVQDTSVDNASPDFFRGNSFSLAQADGAPGQKVGIDLGVYANRDFAGNTYLGQDATYSGKHESRLQPLQRVAHLSGTTVSQSATLSIPVANLGWDSTSWRVAATSPAWINASASASDLAAEHADGVLTVSANPVGAGAQPGVQWGTITLATPARLSVLTGKSPVSRFNAYGEIGLRFRTTLNGKITKLRYYRDAGDVNAHTGRLWRGDGVKLAEVLYPEAAGSGWREVTLPAPVAILAGTDYIVSDNSQYVIGYSPGDLATPSVNGAITGTTGVINSSVGAFPATPTTDNYFRDVVFEPYNQETTQIVGVRLDLSTPTALETWRQANFGTTASTGNAADLADPDGDGLVNLLEFALGTNPTAANASPITTATAGGHLTLTFNRLEPAAVTYTVEASTDLQAWTTVATLPANTEGWTPVTGATVTETGTGASRGVTFTDAPLLSASPKRFLRLRVTKQ